MKHNTTANAANPFGDLATMLKQFKVPGVDMTAIVASRSKDINALGAASETAYAAMQAQASKRNEILTQVMQDTLAAHAQQSFAEMTRLMHPK